MENFEFYIVQVYLRHLGLVPLFEEVEAESGYNLSHYLRYLRRGGLLWHDFYLLSNTKIIIKKKQNYKIYVHTSHKESFLCLDSLG